MVSKKLTLEKINFVYIDTQFQENNRYSLILKKIQIGPKNPWCLHALFKYIKIYC